MMKLGLSVTTEVTQKTELKVSATALQMLLTRLRERDTEHAREQAAAARKESIDAEIAEILTREGQEHVLQDGVTIGGHRLKRVGGTSRTLDLDLLKRTYGLTEADIDECRETKPKKAYIKVSKAGKGGDE